MDISLFYDQCTNMRKPKKLNWINKTRENINTKQQVMEL